MGEVELFFLNKGAAAMAVWTQLTKVDNYTRLYSECSIPANSRIT